MRLPFGQTSRSDKEKWLERYARFGLACHAVVYSLMSVLSFMAALGLSNKKADKSEAVKLIHEQPFGKVLIGTVGIGLLGYVLLRFFQAFKDTRHKGRDFKGIMLRFSYAFIGLAYLALSLYCFKLVFGDDSGGDSRKQFTGEMLAMPAGRWLVGGVAAGFAIAAVYQVYRGFSKIFMKVVELKDSKYEKTFKHLGTVGYSARGVVFGIIAYMFMRVAIEADANEAEGTGGAFKFMQETFGDILMGIMSLGLLAFALFMFVRVKHEKMNFDVGR
jgi:hypothetical protein